MTQKLFTGETTRVTFDLPVELFELYRNSAHNAKISGPQYARLAIWAIECNGLPNNLPPIPGMVSKVVQDGK
jgi:hypothetical protein